MSCRQITQTWCSAYLCSSPDWYEHIDASRMFLHSQLSHCRMLCVRTKQDIQARYDEAVGICRQWLRLRTLSLSAAHESAQEMDARLDEFVSKRESICMNHEDQIYLEMNERSIERAAQQLRDQERWDTRLSFVNLDSSAHIQMHVPVTGD